MSKLTIYDWSNKSSKLQSKFYSARVILPCPCAVYMYKSMILLNNFSSETTWPVSTKFHVAPTVEMGLRVCSNGHAPLTVMPLYMVKKKWWKIHSSSSKPRTALTDNPFISCNDRIEKMLHNICISEVAISLRWASYGPWASCSKLFFHCCADGRC